jgi:hypothetical protein
MLRLLAIAFVAVSSPAWAGCFNFTEHSLETAPPRVTICIDGVCEETTADFQCANTSGAQFGYANGLFVRYVGETVTASINKVPVDVAKITCVEIDDDACFPT